MTGSRTLLIAAAVLLVATALFHATGLTMVADWLPGDRGRIVSLMWLGMSVDWAVIAVLWLLVAWRPQAVLRPIVLISAIVPAFVAACLLGIVGSSHPGGFMLAGSAILAALGAWRLR